MSAPGVVVQSLVVALVPRSSLKHVVPLKNGSQPMAMEIVPKKPQIRSCLVFKPSILRTNILNGIPPGKIQMSSKKTTILKGEISSLQASTFRWYAFVFGGGKRVKFTMSTRPEPLPVSSWARPPGKKTHQKSWILRWEDRKWNPRGDRQGSIYYLMGKLPCIIYKIASLCHINVHEWEFVGCWGDAWETPITHSSGWFLRQSSPSTLLEDWVSSAPVFYESPITTYLSFEGSAHLCYSRILLLSIWKGTRLPQMHDPLNSKCHVLTFLP